MKPKRVFRFSLGTLLVLLTLGCIWLGLEVNQARFEKELAQRITESGGKIRFDYEFDKSGNYLPDAPVPIWSASLGENFSSRIAEVSFTGTTRVTNRLPSTVTGVKRRRVPEQVLEQLNGLRGLRRLLLSNTDVSDDDVNHLSSIRSVEYLRLDGNAISAAAAMQLSCLSKLKKLDLRWTKVEPDEVDVVKEALQGVDVVIDHETNVPPAFWDTFDGDIAVEPTGSR